MPGMNFQTRSSTRLTICQLSLNPSILPCPTRNSALSVSTTSLYVPGSSVP
ncbi:hypothetical protein [Otoolea muris]|uniref:hypothetical protein n=1 Tax=Otoolea muris TaxID=2941515 RepID=UPI003A7F4188